MSDEQARESMEVDVVIVGAGPAGLSAAIKLKQLADEAGEELAIVVLEKGSEVGAHILSGAVIDPIALDDLLPDWRNMESPLQTEVKHDKWLVLGEKGSLDISWLPMPPLMNNHGKYVVSLGNVCRWLAEIAEGMGIEVFPGFAASEVVYGDNGEVKGVVAGVMGIDRDGKPGPHYEPGMELLGRYTLIGEGVRGSLAKQLMAKYELDKDCDPQKFGIGLKELWQVPDENFKKGLVQHTVGYPTKDKDGTAGGFLYHLEENGEKYISVGYVVHLNYKNPYLSPYDEFQTYKHHPDVAKHLEGGTRISYGARAITEGGLQSVPKLAFPGGALIGCSAGFMNLPRIKGSHNAMGSGIFTAEILFEALKAGRSGDELEGLQEAYEASHVYKDIYRVRNAKPLMGRFGSYLGLMFSGIEMWITTLLGGFSPLGTLRHTKTDAKSLEPASKHKPIEYEKPDGVLSFDKLTSVSFSATNHEEDQPVHLKLLDPSIPLAYNLPEYAEPAQRYCPAGVYEILTDETTGEKTFQINAQNCVHCKTCDIKDPSQNINWCTPQGGEGPNYPNM